MTDQPTNDRVPEFRQEIEDLGAKGSVGKTESLLLKVSSIALGLGVVLAVIGAGMLTTTSDGADQRAFLGQTSFLATVIVIVAAALFVRYSLGRYLRFWMIRLIHEQRTQTDRIVDAIDRASQPR